MYILLLVTSPIEMARFHSNKIITSLVIMALYSGQAILAKSYFNYRRRRQINFVYANHHNLVTSLVIMALYPDQAIL